MNATPPNPLPLEALWGTRHDPDGPPSEPTVDDLLRRALVRLEREERTQGRGQRCFWVVQTDQPAPWLLDVAWPCVEGAGEMELTWGLAETLDPLAALYTNLVTGLRVELERPNGWHQRARLLGTGRAVRVLVAAPPTQMDDGDFPRLAENLHHSFEQGWNIPFGG